MNSPRGQAPVQSPCPACTDGAKRLPGRVKPRCSATHSTIYYSTVLNLASESRCGWLRVHYHGRADTPSVPLHIGVGRSESSLVETGPAVVSLSRSECRDTVCRQRKKPRGRPRGNLFPALAEQSNRVNRIGRFFSCEYYPSGRLAERAQADCAGHLPILSEEFVAVDFRPERPSPPLNASLSMSSVSTR